MIGRRTFLLSAALIVLAAGACVAEGQAGADSDEMALGRPNAPITLIEYTSPVCPHCAAFHRDVHPQLLANYVNTGRVRLIFRELATSPPQVAVAGFQIARCNDATPEQYYARLGALFEQQRAIFAGGAADSVRAKLVEIGAAAGLSEPEVMECISDPSGAERVRRMGEAGRNEFNVTASPTLILNGRKLEDPAALTYAGLARMIEVEALTSMPPERGQSPL